MRYYFCKIFIELIYKKVYFIDFICILPIFVPIFVLSKITYCYNNN